MILTEEEAKTKRCQESFGDRFTTKDGTMMAVAGTIYRGADPVVTSPSFCIGSACMAWRWYEEDKGLTSDPPRTYGYCGKAGKP